MVEPPKLWRVLLLLVISCSGAYCQQNLFNVPSSDITLRGKLFFQQQVNFSKGITDLNTTICYGLGSQAEVGFNIINLEFQSQRPYEVLTNGDRRVLPDYPFAAINLQKAFTLNSTFKVAGGVQLGLSRNWTAGYFSYLNLVSIIKPTMTKLITGFYDATDSFIGPGQRQGIIKGSPIGIESGVEQTIIPDKFYVVAENITGRHTMGESTIGVAYYLNPNWVISSGYLFPNPRSSTSRSLVMELTYVPSSTEHRKIFHHGHVHVG